jgi:hypothetical protein
MARTNLVGTVGTGLRASIGQGAASSPSVATAQAAGTALTYATFATDLATLVADGATPTQAHVTAVNNDWTTLKAAIDLLVADVAAISAGPAITGDVVVSVNGSTVLTINKYDEIMESIRRLIAGSSLLTGNYDIRSIV